MEKLIKASDLKKALAHIFPPIIRDDKKRKMDIALEALNCIDNAPAIEAEPVRHGEWVDPDCYFPDYWKCTACNEELYFECDPTAYCPNCGAKMDGGKQDAAD